MNWNQFDIYAYLNGKIRVMQVWKYPGSDRKGGKFGELYNQN